MNFVIRYHRISETLFSPKMLIFERNKKVVKFRIVESQSSPDDPERISRNVTARERFNISLLSLLKL